MKTMITEQTFEEMCEAFADADGGEQAVLDAIGGGKALPEVPYRDLPEASKYWYRVRMAAALKEAGIAVEHSSTMFASLVDG